VADYLDIFALQMYNKNCIHARKFVFCAKNVLLSVFFLITQETGREIGVFLFNFATKV